METTITAITYLIIFTIIVGGICLVLWGLAKIAVPVKDIVVDHAESLMSRISPTQSVYNVVIKIGITTREELTYELGPPRVFNANAVGETLTWFYNDKSFIIIEFHNPPAAPIKLRKPRLEVVLINNVVISVSS
jgi:hypothetical protein